MLVKKKNKELYKLRKKKTSDNQELEDSDNIDENEQNQFSDSLPEGYDSEQGNEEKKVEGFLSFAEEQQYICNYKLWLVKKIDTDLKVLKM